MAVERPEWVVAGRGFLRNPFRFAWGAMSYEARWCLFLVVLLALAV
jgi:hypothetical protein